jgi:2-dehydro-3-deoxygluconokinase
MKKVFCFGELLLRMSPQLNGGWLNDASMPVYLGGSELNTAIALSLWDIPVAYSTALPDNALSKDILSALRIKNIDTSKIITSGGRIGCYYLPQGTDLKHSAVIYDRAYSSFSQMQPGQIDWDAVLQDVGWFHFSAITPALNDNCAAVCKEALICASQKNITISVDLNYRSKLWQYGKEPSMVMPGLVQYCDVVMGNIWAAEKMLQVPIKQLNEYNKSACIEQAGNLAEYIRDRYPKTRYVANTFRFDKADGLSYYTTLLEKERHYVSEEYHADHILDKVGTGDCFMAGLIYGICNHYSGREMIDFATSAAFRKLFIKGDHTTCTVEEVLKGDIKNG